MVIHGNRRLWIASAITAVLVAVCVYFYFDPSDSVFFPRCPFLSLTGFQCPGCGSQRAIHALLHGDIASAWHYNCMLLIFAPLIVLLILSEFTRKSHPHFYTRINSAPVIWGSFIVLMAWWILRNLF